MGAFKYIRKNERNSNRDAERKKEILTEVRSRPLISRMPSPSKIARAHSLGYKAKQGYITVLARVGKGSFRRPRPVHARRPSKAGIYYNLSVSKQKIAEDRVLKRYPNMKLLGSYLLTEDGKDKWFEVLLKEAK
jgi:large subunit ribosomal protein L15e